MCLQLFLSSALSAVIFITLHRTAHMNNYLLNTITLWVTLYVKRSRLFQYSGNDGLVRMANYIFTQFRTGSNHLLHAPGCHNNSVKLKSPFWLLQFPMLILKDCGQIVFYQLPPSCERFFTLLEKYLKISIKIISVMQLIVISVKMLFFSPTLIRLFILPFFFFF